MALWLLQAVADSEGFPLLMDNTDAQRRSFLVQVYEALQRGSVHEALICTAGYVLGDYGNTMKGVPPAELFALLQERFPSMPPHAKGILLSAYLKLCLMAPQDIQLKESVRLVIMKLFLTTMLLEPLIVLACGPSSAGMAEGDIAQEKSSNVNITTI